MVQLSKMENTPVEISEVQFHIQAEPLSNPEVDIKTKNLEAFFEKYNSPLKDHSKVFTDTASKYDLDYRLLPAIACMESSCGKKLIPGSFNPFGWGIYGGKYIAFQNYEEAIETVAKGIKENYVDKGLVSPEEMAPVYTPPAYGHWLKGVTFFMTQIGQIATPVATKS